MQIYTQDLITRYYLIAAVSMSSRYSSTLSCIFPICHKLKRFDQKLGFKVIDSEISPDFKGIMRDLFDNPGEYFVSRNKYADISVYLLYSMTEGSE